MDDNHKPDAPEPQPQIRKFKSRYWHGDTVYLRVRRENVRGEVDEIRLNPTGHLYQVLWEDNSSSLYYESQLAHEFTPDYGGASA